MQADQDLIRRDPQLPGLSILLDEDTFLPAFQAAYPELKAQSAKATYVRYKPATNALVLFEIQTPVGPGWAVGKTYCGAAGKIEKDLEGGLQSIAPHTTAALFPYDRKLKSLRRLAEDKRADFLQKLLPGQPELWQAHLSPLAYKPERRFVGKLETPHLQAVLRLHTPSGYPQKAHGLSSNASLQIARQLGTSDRQHAVVMEWLPGRLLREALRDPVLDTAAVMHVAQALAALHRQSAQNLQTHSFSQQKKQLEALTHGLSVLVPRLAPLLAWLSQRLLRQLAELDAPLGVIHGDFYDKQILLGDPVAFLDLDEVAWGHAAADLGLFMAHLERDALLGHLPKARLGPIAEALRIGYAQRVRGLEAYTALGLLSLAPHPFRNRLPDWPQKTEALVALAETHLLAGVRR